MINIKELKEMLIKIEAFNKVCLAHEYERRNAYVSINDAKAEYINEINMCIERYLLKIGEYTNIDFSELYKSCIIDDTYELLKLEYLTVTRLCDNYLKNIYNIINLIVNTL